MQQIIYISQAAPDLDSGEVFKIIEKSAANNARNELTGFLLFSERRFLQLLEGSAEAIDAVMDKLQHDKRHNSIEVVERSAIHRRSFPKWTMKRLLTAPASGTLADSVPELRDAPAGVTAVVDEFLRPKAA